MKKKSEKDEYAAFHVCIVFVDVPPFLKRKYKTIYYGRIPYIILKCDIMMLFLLWNII